MSQWAPVLAEQPPVLSLGPEVLSLRVNPATRDGHGYLIGSMRASDVIEYHRGVVPISAYPSLSSSWRSLVANGRLLRALPGIGLDAGLAEEPRPWIRAVQLWKPNAVIGGGAAAALTFAPELQLTSLHVYCETRQQDVGPLRLHRMMLPAHMVMCLGAGALRVTTPAATCLTAGLEGDLTPGTTGLRLGAVSVAGLKTTANSWRTRRSNALAEVVRDLSGNPWSIAEVQAHRLFRKAGITGWFGNHRIRVGSRTLVLDVAIPEAKVAFEINSFQFHSSREAMLHDSVRANALTALGWRVYTLTPGQITQHEEETGEFIRSVVWEQHRWAGKRQTDRRFS